MKTLPRILFGSLCALLTFGQATAEGISDRKPDEKNAFSIAAQIRPRGEYRNGALWPREEGAGAAWFVNNRARVSMQYDRPGLTMRLSAQHVGVWGQDPQIDKNGRFVLNEAWARIASRHGIFAQLGRQALSYDDQRILGGLDWNVAGRHHDALKLGYENDRHKLHLILAFNQNDEKIIGGTYYKAGAQPYKTMQTLWYHYRAGECPFGLSLLVMNLGFEAGDELTQRSHTRHLQTMGTYLTYKPGAWNWEGAFYYQSGRHDGADVSACMASIATELRIGKRWSLSAGIDYLSGSKPGDSKYEAFDPLYGTHHKFYGAMDYFYASGWLAEDGCGLLDNRIGAAVKASAAVTIKLDCHYFLTGVKIPDMDRSLGTELDLQLDWRIMPDVSLSVGYSTFFGTETMQEVKGGHRNSWQDWGWVSININPRILFTKW